MQRAAMLLEASQKSSNLQRAEPLQALYLLLLVSQSLSLLRSRCRRLFGVLLTATAARRLPGLVGLGLGTLGFGAGGFETRGRRPGLEA